MPHTTIVSPELLEQHLYDPQWAIIDCRFSLSDPDYGREAWRKQHIPRAVHIDLERDLSGKKTEHTGRHPLPDPVELARKLRAAGINDDSQVIVYDDAFGSMAVRLWWSLRWLGHPAVALLDGGFPRWKREGQPLTSEVPPVAEGNFSARTCNDCWVSGGFVEKAIRSGEYVLIDARPEDRYEGERDPIDPIAGHIPGAINRPFEDNLDLGGNFLPAEELRTEFEEILQGRMPENVIQTCGSGVTCCHNMLAMEIACLGGSHTYIGSWSEWITDRHHPIIKGPEPGST